MKHLLRSLLLLFIGIGSSHAQWQWIHPVPQGNTITCLQFPAFQTGYAGTDKGIILKTNNGGSAWTTCYTGRFENISGLYFSTVNNGLALQKEYLMKTGDGGTTWNSFYRFNDIQANQMQFIHPDTGWVTGEMFGMWFLKVTADGGQSFFDQFTTPEQITAVYFLNGGSGWMSLSNGDLYSTTDYGLTWNITGTPSSSGFNSMQFLTSNQGYACGDNGEIYSTTDGGSNWNNLSNPGSFTSISYNSVYFTSPNDGVVAGTDGFMLYTADGGQTWNLAAVPGWMDGYTLTGNGSSIITGGADGELFISTDNGQTWTSSASGTTEGLALNAITRNPAGKYACGDNGLLMTSSGSIWAPLSSPVNFNLYGIASNSALNIVVAGEAGTILRTTNGGASWSVITSGTNENLRSAATNGSAYFITGDNETVLTSINGGLTWTPVSTPLSGAGFIYTSIQFPSQDTGFIVTDQNDLLISTDGGQNWDFASVPSMGAITGIHFINGMDGWLSTNANEIYATTDGGYNWNWLFEYTKPVVLNGIYFSDALNGYTYADGLMLRTVDGGNFWSEEYYPSQKKINGMIADGPGLLTVGAGNASIIARVENCSFSLVPDTLCMENTYNGTHQYTGNLPGRSGVVEMSDEFGDFNNPIVVGNTQSGVSNFSLFVPGGIIDATGYRLRAVFSNPPLISSVSTEKTILVSPSVQVNSSGPLVFCPGDSVILFVNGIPGWTYQWFKDGNLLAGATSDMLTVYSGGTYTVTIMDGFCGFTTADTDVLVSCTGIHEVVSGEISMYPNPTGGTTLLTWASGRTVSNVSILDLSGRTILSYQTEGNNLEIDAVKLAPGLYMICLTGELNHTLRLLRK